MKKKYYLGSDIGTSSCKTVIINKNGKVLGEASKEYWPTLNNGSAAEIRPDIWYESFLNTLKNACENANILPGDICGIGLTGQMVTLVCFDKRGVPLRPAILWFDKRGSEYLDNLNINEKEMIRETTCNPINSTFTLPKLLWLKYHEPYTFKKIYKILWSSDFIRMKLTGTYYTDMTYASSSLMYDLRKNTWSEEILDLFGLPKSIFPEILPASKVVGKISRDAAIITRLKEGVPVIVGTGDIGADNISAGIAEAEQGVIRFGTCATISICSDLPLLDKDDKCPCSSHSIPGLFLIQGTSASFGESIRWLKKVFYPDIAGDSNAYKIINKEVSEIGPFSSNILFHSFTKAAPYWLDNKKGQFTGIESNHKRGHFARALFEGISFDLRVALLNLQKIDGVKIPGSFIALGGGTNSSELCKIVSNVLGCGLTLVEEVSASMGVAILAVIGINKIKEQKKYINKIIKYSEEILKDEKLVDFYDGKFKLFKKIYENLKDISNEFK